jgi:hypothetical protein
MTSLIFLDGINGEKGAAAIRGEGLTSGAHFSH